MEVQRIGSDRGFIREFTGMQSRVRSLETNPSGNIVIRDSISTFDPATGSESIFGKLPDGSFGYQPFIGDIEPPPLATAPIVSAEAGVFVVKWDGLFYAGLDKPKDFEHLNVLAYQVVNGVALDGAVVVGIIRNSSSPVFVSTDVCRAGDIWEFAFTSEDFNGNTSSESLRSAPLLMKDVLSTVDEAWNDLKADVQEAYDNSASAQAAATTASGAAQAAKDDALAAVGIAQGKGKVLTQSAQPGAADRNTSTLWIDTTNGANTPKRWDGNQWVAVSDKKAVDAAEAAANAVTVAGQAFNAATNAATVAGQAQNTANGKNRNWYQISAPAGTDHRDGDLWFDTDDGNKMHLWKSTTNTWTPFQDAAIASAQSAATTALTAANGKNRIIWSTENASGTTGYNTGDTWFKRNPTTQTIIGQWEFSDGAWKSRVIGDDVFGNISAGKITSGFIDSARISANSISVDKLLVASGTNLAYNGSAEFANTQGYDFVRSTTDFPSGYTASWQSPASTGNRNFLNSPAVQVKPNTSYKISVWVKASKAGSIVYLEPMSGSTVAGERPTPTYAFTNIEVPTAWTKWSSIITTGTAPLGTLYFRWFVNHANGTVQDAIFNFTGFEMSEMNGGELIVEGSILGNQIKAGEIQAGHIAAGAITAPKIASKSITTDKLVISSTDNLIVEADFSNNGLSWDTNTFITIDRTGGRGSLPAMKFTGTSINWMNTFNLSNRIPVGADDRLRGSFYIKTSAAAAAGAFRLMVRRYTSATVATEAAIATSEAIPANTWTLVEGISGSFPTGTIAVEFYLSVKHAATATVSHIDYASVTRAFSGNLLVDGAINGQRIIGAILETNPEPNVGVKVDTSGVTAHGTGTYYEITNPGVPIMYNTRAVLTQRPSPFSQSAVDRWPGLWFEGERQDGQGASRPNISPGIAASTADSFGVNIMSSQQTANTARSNISVDPTLVAIFSNDAKNTSGANVNAPKSNTSLVLTPWDFQARTSSPEFQEPHFELSHSWVGNTELKSRRALTLQSPQMYMRNNTVGVYQRIPRGILYRFTNNTTRQFTGTATTLSSHSISGFRGYNVAIYAHIHGSVLNGDANYVNYELRINGSAIQTYTKPYALRAYGDTTVFIGYYLFTSDSTVTLSLTGQRVVGGGTPSIVDTQLTVVDIGGPETGGPPWM